MLETGAVVAGRYEVKAVLGKGSAGVVLRCRDRQLDRLLAVKLVDGGVLGGVDRFLDEAQALAALQHPSVVALYDYGVEGDRPFMALEWVTGGSLRDQLNARSFPVEEATRLSDQVLAAHVQGILHRDVKPENVLLTARGDAKLADFGLAKSQASSVRTATGMIVGTPEYLAPELFQGARASPASDLYSWGCLAYALVNRRPPHTGDLSSVVRASVRGGFQRGLEQGGLKIAIEAALRPRPEDRPPVSELRAILAGRGPEPPKPGANLDDSATRVVSSSGLAPRGAVAAAARGAGRSSAGAGAGATPTGRRRWLAGLALAGVLVGVGLGTWAMGERPPMEELPPQFATPPVEATAEPAYRTAARSWMKRARAVKTEEVLRELHGTVYTGDKNYQSSMHKVRVQGRDPGQVGLDLAALRTAELPEVDALRAAAPALAAYLGDAGLKAAERFELYEALQGFDHIDGYFAAWGLPEPYGVAPLLAALVPRETLAHERDESLGPMATANSPLPEGRHTIFEWDRLWDQTFP